MGSALPPRTSPMFAFTLDMMRKSYTWVSNPMSYLRMGEAEERNEATIALSFGFKTVGDCVEYEYDFGSSWRGKIHLENIERKNIPDFIPGIAIVGGRGKTVPEYGEGDGTRYNRNQLNEQLSGMDAFVVYPSGYQQQRVPNQEEADDDDEDDQDEEEEQDEDANEDSDLEILSDDKAVIAAAKSLFGKRNRKPDDDGDSNRNIKKRK